VDIKDIADDISARTITAFLLLMVLVWLFGALGIVLAGLLRPQLPAPAARIMDPAGVADARLSETAIC